jgi:hypothetical protein
MQPLNFLIAFLLFFMADVALSFPQFIRLGYNGCSSCHVSPAGGGTLTPYGRSMSEEVSTFGGEGTGALLGGALKATPPAEVMIGGDTRYVRLITPHFVKSFLMQNDAELAVRVSELTFVASAGKYAYGEEMVLQSRRHYVLWQPSENFAARVGLFMPAYGIMQADHTAAVRETLEFGQGQESYNTELSFRGEYGEVFLTAAMPKRSTIELSNDPAPAATADTFSYLARAAAYIGKAAQVGASYRLMVHPDQAFHHSVGAFALAGIARDGYVLAEYDRNFEFINYGKPENVGYVETGYEIWRGVNVQALYEFDKGHVPGLGVQLFPVPHVELLGRVKWVRGQAMPVLMVHSNW